MRVASFALGLGAAFALAFALGSVFDSAETGSAAPHGGSHDDPSAHDDGEATSIDGHQGHGSASGAPSGLSVSEGGYTLRLDPTFVEAGRVGELQLRVEGPGGETVRDFDRLHDRELHLIVVRRDGAHFQHLHPEVDSDGTWTAALRLPAAGVYRAFADFSVGGSPHTLAADLFAAGDFEPRPFPASEPVDRVAGYEVRLSDASPRAGQPAELGFLVTRNGQPVDLQTYLGAQGHLVALREGDLAFLHVHPEAPADEGEHGTGGGHSTTQGGAPNAIPFSAHFPTAGRYRLYLQFKHADRVRTAQFTVGVAR